MLDPGVGPGRQGQRREERVEADRQRQRYNSWGWTEGVAAYRAKLIMPRRDPEGEWWEKQVFLLLTFAPEIWDVPGYLHRGTAHGPLSSSKAGRTLSDRDGHPLRV